MKRISVFLGLLLALTFSTEVEAQLSDRINNPSSIKAGTRPVQGNFGFFIGLELDQVEDALDDATDVEDAIPLINVRYYYRDDLVIRAGVSYYKKARSLIGEIDTTVNTVGPSFGGQGVGAFYEHKSVSAYTLLHLGIEKHFNPSNILDGYVGINLPIGYERASDYTTFGNDGSTDFEKITASRFSFVYGVELFIGANAFVADLPLAIGAELGIRGIGVTGDKFKNEYEGSTGGVSYSGEFYTNNIDDFEDELVQADADRLEFSSLKANSFDAQPMIRFVLSYYFK